jgi:lipopolysaccharide biosynthesis protein
MQELDSRHNLNIFYVENRGRDFASFIHLIKKIEVSDFDLVIKLHTKRSQSAWFKVLVDYFIGSDKRIKSHRKHSEKFPYALLCHPLLRYQVDNTAKSNPALIKLYERLSTLNYHLVSNWSFPAGSMFATSTSFLHSLSLVFDELFDFDFESEEEYSQSSQAHMLERFVGLHAYQIGDGVISPFCKDYFDLRAATIALI